MPSSPLYFLEGNEYQLADSTTRSGSDITSFNSLHQSLTSKTSAQALNAQSSMSQALSYEFTSTLPTHELIMPLLSSSFPDVCSFSPPKYSIQSSKSSSASRRHLSIMSPRSQHIQKPIQTIIPYSSSEKLTYVPLIVTDVTIGDDRGNNNEHKNVKEEWSIKGQGQEEMEKEKKHMRNLVDLLSTDWSTKEDAPMQWHEMNRDTIVNSHSNREDTSSETSTTYPEQDVRPFRILKDAIPKSRLKFMCGELGLNVGGNKSQLAERLDHYCMQEEITAYDVRMWFEDRDKRDEKIGERPISKGKKRMWEFIGEPTGEPTAEIVDERDSRNYSRSNPKRVRCRNLGAPFKYEQPQESEQLTHMKVLKNQHRSSNDSRSIDLRTARYMNSRRNRKR